MTSLFRRAQRLVTRTELHGYESAEVIDTIVLKTEIYQVDKFDNCELYNTLNRLQPKTVLDFGGGAGVHAKQARWWGFNISWAIVETPSMVAHCNKRSYLPKWFTKISEAVDFHSDQVDLVLCSGALQYHPTPNLIASELADLGAKELLYQRLRLNAPNDIEVSWLSDHGPGPASGPEALVHIPRYRVMTKPFLAAHLGYEWHSIDDGFLFQRRVEP